MGVKACNNRLPAHASAADRCIECTRIVQRCKPLAGEIHKCTEQNGLTSVAPTTSPCDLRRQNACPPFCSRREAEYAEQFPLLSRQLALP